MCNNFQPFVSVGQKQKNPFLSSCHLVSEESVENPPSHVVHFAHHPAQTGCKPTGLSNASKSGQKSPHPAGTAQSWIQEITAAKPNISIKHRICSRRLSADLFHLLSPSLFPTCDYTTCNNNVDTRKMNKKIWLRSKTFFTAASTIIYRFELREVTTRSNDIGSVGQKTALLYDMLTSDSTPVCDS